MIAQEAGRIENILRNAHCFEVVFIDILPCLNHRFDIGFAQRVSVAVRACLDLCRGFKRTDIAPTDWAWLLALVACLTTHLVRVVDGLPTCTAHKANLCVFEATFVYGRVHWVADTAQICSMAEQAKVLELRMISTDDAFRLQRLESSFDEVFK